MSLNAVSSLTDPYLQSLVSSAVNNGLSTNAATSASGVTLPQDNAPHISPFAQILSTLQNLQQTDPSKYQQVTAQIATNLQNAATTATANGDTAQAAQLNQLATDFTNASQNNTMPNISDLAKAMSGAHGHHHHHHAHAPASSSDSDAVTNGSSAANSSSTSATDLSKLISAFFTNSASSAQNSLDPLSIVNNTLAQAGISK
jgi:hypothetical protein